MRIAKNALRSEAVLGGEGARSPSEEARTRADTKARILDTAEELFMEHGYEGTSIRAITRQARANLGAVTYHFGSKKNLYEEVLRSVGFEESEIKSMRAEGVI